MDPGGTCEAEAEAAAVAAQAQMDLPNFPRELSSLFSGISSLPEISAIPLCYSTSTSTGKPYLPPLPLPAPMLGNKGRRKSNYSMEFKLQVLTWAKNTSFNAASRQFQVDRKVVKDWVESEQEIRKFIEEGQEFRKRLSGAGKKAQDGGLETHLVTWINSYGDEKHLVSRTMIQCEALKYSKNKDFKASKGWLDRFLRRNRDAIGRKIKDNNTEVAQSSQQCPPSSSSSAVNVNVDTPSSTFTPSFALEHFLTATSTTASASASGKSKSSINFDSNSTTTSQNQNQTSEASRTQHNSAVPGSVGAPKMSTAAAAQTSRPTSTNMCVNCCEKLPAISDALSRPSNSIVREIRTCITPSSNSFGLQINPATEASRPVTLDQEITARVKVNYVLASVYKLNFIDQLNLRRETDGSSRRRKYRDKNRIGNLQLSLCRRCGTALTQLYKLYNDFNSFRKADSVLANLINELDDCIHNLAQNNINSNATSTSRIGSEKTNIFMNQTIFEDEDDDGDDPDCPEDHESGGGGNESNASDLYEDGQLPFSMTLTTNQSPPSHENVRDFPNGFQNFQSSTECILPDHKSLADFESQEDEDDNESIASADTFPSDEQEFKYDPSNTENETSSLDLKVFSPTIGGLHDNFGEENLDDDETADLAGANEMDLEAEMEKSNDSNSNQCEPVEPNDPQRESLKKRKKYSSRSLEFKLEVVDWAKTNSTQSTSRKFDVPPKCIREWKKNESLIRQFVATSGGKRQRVTGFVMNQNQTTDADPSSKHCDQNSSS